MSKSSDKDRTELFTVVGAPYVPEHHAETNRLQNDDTLPPEIGIAGLWLVFYVAIFGAVVFGHEEIGQVVQLAWSYLR